MKKWLPIVGAIWVCIVFWTGFVQGRAIARIDCQQQGFQSKPGEPHAK